MIEVFKHVLWIFKSKFFGAYLINYSFAHSGRFSTCFYDISSKSCLLIPFLFFRYLYIKMFYSQIIDFNLEIKTKNLILEFTNIKYITNQYEHLRRLFDKNNVSRVVLNYQIKNLCGFNPDNQMFQILRDLKKLNFDNVAVDFYLANFSQQAVRELMNFLNRFPIIKHFSIYFNDVEYKGLEIKNNVFGFRRYHVNMWAKLGYETDFELIGLEQKQYLGIGNKAITRCGDDFYTIETSFNNWRLKRLKNIKHVFLNFNDGVDRLKYFHKLSDEEFERYTVINKWEYKELMVMHDDNVYIVHTILIERLIKKHLPLI